jgi:TetR/AcrR family transcriptional repressor of nem operon
MARPREFDVDDALEKAMHVFWAKGYEGSSLSDLLDAMGIARGSLYKAFKDKHSIYLAALDSYDRLVVGPAVAMLRDAAHGDGLKRIRRLLGTAGEAVALRGDRRGCLLCNAAVDQAPNDPVVRARVLAAIRRVERAIETALSQSAAAQGWPARRRRETARQLLNAYMGLRVLAKAGYSPAELDAIAAASLTPLQP